MRHSKHPADDERYEGVSWPDRSDHKTSEPLNPFVGWSIVIVISLGLWWGLWLGVSSLISALR